MAGLSGRIESKLILFCLVSSPSPLGLLGKCLPFLPYFQKNPIFPVFTLQPFSHLSIESITCRHVVTVMCQFPFKRYTLSGLDRMENSQD
jgi:hypothetical protein